ncbi:SDR family oxidoreductase [Actinomadura rugatobispora]|uniref:SDR family oxidoreductase n=1 Tax=Actinomadura rugatobispora TaxID=1994 RepID=A0ABW1A0A8_9ACTN|nr:SDR family oxidoreductase [Actinomadura rugatobispora]
MIESLEGRTAVVTGGSRGIGKAIAARYAAAGANVVIVSRREESLRAAAAELGERAAWYAASVRDPDAPERTMRLAVERFGGIDILVNNAAVNPFFGSLLEISAEQLAVTAEANQAAPLLWTQAAVAAGLGRTGGGAVVNVASIGGLVTEPGLGYYNATKAALLHLTRQLAVELAPRVRVNSIAPGIVRTDMARVLWEEHEAEVRSKTPLGRIGEPADVAAAALFLSAPSSSWITGSMLVIDGGMSLL